MTYNTFVGTLNLAESINHSLHGSAELTVLKATRLVNGTPQFLDPGGSKTPEPIDIKLHRGD